MWRLVLIFSIVLNVTLGLIAGLLLQASRQQPRRAARGAAPVATVVSPMDQQPLAPEQSPPAPSVRTNRFHWSKVESEDYEQYMANLRAIGCPESTLRGIILAEVRELFENRRFALDEPSFWAAGKARQTADRKREQQDRDLHREASELTQRLLGEDYTDETTKSNEDLVGQAIVRLIAGPLSEKSFDQLYRTIMSWSERADSVRYDAIKMEAEEAELKALCLRFKEKVKNLLTPSQYEETCQRMAALSMLDDGGATALKPFELRQVCQLHRQAYGDWTEFPGGALNGRDEDPSSRWRFISMVKEYLGEQRFVDFQSEADNSFRQLVEFAAERRLPRPKALEVMELRALAEIEVERIASLYELADADREQQLREVQEALSTGVMEAMGEQVYQGYLAHGGEWLTNSIPQ